MKYVVGHTEKNIDKWKNKKWYHQRFDGAPYLIHMIAEAEIETDKNLKFGTNFDVHYCFYEDGKADWYIEIEDIKKVYTNLINSGKENPSISSDLIKKWMPAQINFYKKCLEIGNIDLKKLSDNELITLHNHFLEIILKKNSSSSIIDGFALGTDELLAEMIKKIYEKSEIRNMKRFSEVFSILTAPTHLSFINEAEIELLKIADLIKKDKSNWNLIDEHQKKFFWIRNNYVDAHILTRKYFETEIKKILKLDIDINNQVKQVENTPKINQREKSELIKKLDFDNELKLLIKISEDFTYWQDERKKGTFWTAHYTYLILKEICIRKKITLDEIKYMTPREVNDIFSICPTQKELQERRKGCVNFWDENGHECLSGSNFKQIMDTVLGSQDLSTVDDFRGLTACTGKARGRVKVVRTSKEISKVKKGDILVAVMTRPDYVPAMKKAAAIITNEGGVTCHAAIISRELGIPCIIGTKIATKILKDNMIVEVNANHSWVRIIRGENETLHKKKSKKTS